MNRLDEAFLRRPIAHRGLHDRNAGYPENSMASFRRAIDAGYGIELDLQLSSDGHAIVFHDDTLDRLTDQSGPVRERMLNELRMIRLKHSDESIPSLCEVLELVNGRAPLLIEMKDQHGALGQTHDGLERALASALEGYAGPVAVMSFNPHMVCQFRPLAPDICRGFVTAAFDAASWPGIPPERLEELGQIGDVECCAIAFISHQVTDLSAMRVTELKSQGLDILCWTVRSQDVENTARKIADNITFENYLAAT